MSNILYSCRKARELYAHCVLDASTSFFEWRSSEKLSDSVESSLHLAFLTGVLDSEEFRARLRDDPSFYLQYRKELEATLAGGFEALWRGTPALEKITEITTEHMKKHIKDPDVLAAMMPSFELGCRRFTPGDHYLHALAQDNVKLIWEHIDHVTDSEIVLKSGLKRKVDVIICASGFETSYEPRFPIVGRDGYSLAENWGKDKQCESYMGATVAQLPNFFSESKSQSSAGRLAHGDTIAFMPPICPVIGSAVPGIQATSSYILRVIDRIQHDSLKSVCVKEKAQKEFNEWAQSRFPTMVFTGSCQSWCKLLRSPDARSY